MVIVGCTTLPTSRLLAAPETSAETALRRAGLSDAIIEELLRPFLSGVFIDRELSTSSHVLAMVLRSFARGRIGLPAEGMAGLPRAIADPLPADLLDLDTPVAEVTPAGSAPRPATSTAGPSWSPSTRPPRPRCCRPWRRYACTATPPTTTARPSRR